MIPSKEEFYKRVKLLTQRSVFYRIHIWKNAQNAEEGPLATSATCVVQNLQCMMIRTAVEENTA